MAKMFYSIEETAERLGIGVDQVRQMADEGKLQSFRDGAKVMFKRDQIEAMAGGESGASAPPADSTPSSSDTDAIDLASVTQQDTPDKPKSATATGISVFDADEVEMADPMAQTVVSGGLDTDEEDLVLESVGSGSGLLDLTRESDDTSLGAELLDEIYPAGSDAKDASSAGSIFEQAGGVESSGAVVDTPTHHAQVNVIEAEAEDPVGSGFTGGLLAGALISMILVALVVFTTQYGIKMELTTNLSKNMGAFGGGLAFGTLILGVIGFFVGKAFKK